MDSSNVVCNFYNQEDRISCDIEYGRCGMNYTNTDRGIISSTPQIVIIEISNHIDGFCFVITATNGNNTIQIKGKFNGKCKCDNNIILTLL